VKSNYVVPSPSVYSFFQTPSTKLFIPEKIPSFTPIQNNRQNYNLFSLIREELRNSLAYFMCHFLDTETAVRTPYETHKILLYTQILRRRLFATQWRNKKVIFFLIATAESS